MYLISFRSLYTLGSWKSPVPLLTRFSWGANQTNQPAMTLQTEMVHQHCFPEFRQVESLLYVKA